MNAFAEWFDYNINEESSDFWKSAYVGSLTGKLEEAITGKPRYDINWEEYDPNILQDIGSMAVSFLMPLDLLTFWGGGKFVGQPLANLATAGMKKRVGAEFGKRAWDTMIPAALAQAGTLATYEGAMGGAMASINGENILEGIGKGMMHGAVMGGVAGLAGGGLMHLNANLLKGLKGSGKLVSKGEKATAKLTSYDRSKMLATGLPGQIAAEAGVFTAGETLETAIDPERDVRLKDVVVSLGKNIGLFSLLKGQKKLIQKGKEHVKLLEEHEMLKRTTNSLNKKETKESKPFHNTYDVIVERIAELEAKGDAESLRAAEALKEPRDAAKSKALNLDKKHFENRDELKQLRETLGWAEKNATDQAPQTSVENFRKIVKSLQSLIEVESKLGDTGEYKALTSEIEFVKKQANDLLNDANKRVIDYAKEQELLATETPQEKSARVLQEAKKFKLKEIEFMNEKGEMEIRPVGGKDSAPIDVIDAALKPYRQGVKEKIKFKEAGAPVTYIQGADATRRTAPVAEKQNVESGIYNETTKKFNSKKAEANVQSSIVAVEKSKLSNEHKQILASAISESGRESSKLRQGTSVAMEILDFVERKYKKSIDKLSKDQLDKLIVDFAKDKTGFDVMGHKTEKQFRDMGLNTAEITSLRKQANRIHDGVRELFNPKYGTLHKTIGREPAYSMLERAGTKYSPGETTRYRVDVQGGISGFKKWFSWLNKQKKNRINYAEGRSIDKGLANNLLKLAFDRGLRPTEAAEYLRAKDINVEEGSIRIQRAKKGGGVDIYYDKKMARELHQYIEKNKLSPDAKLFGFKDTADYNKFIEHIAKKSGADIMVYDVQEGRFIEFGKQKVKVLGVDIEAGKGLQKGYALRAIYEREGERIDWAAEQARLNRKTKPSQYKKSGAPIPKTSKEQVESIAAEMETSAKELGEQKEHFKKKFPQITIMLKKSLGKYNGEYVLGRITGKVVEIAKGRAGADTMPHEVAHHVVDILREFGDKRSKELIKKGEKLFGGEEQLVQRVGEYAANRLRNKSLVSKAKSWIQEFWSNMKVKLGWYTEKDITRFLGRKLMTGKIPTGEIANFKAKHQTRGEAIEEKKAINASANTEIRKGNIPVPVLREAKETIFGTSKLKDYTKWATVEQMRQYNEFVHNPKNWHVNKIEEINAEYHITPEVSKQHLRDMGVKDGIPENATLQTIKQYRSFIRQTFTKPIAEDNTHDWILGLKDREYKAMKVLGRAITPVWLVLKNHGGKVGKKISDKLLNHEWAEHVLYKGPMDEGIHLMRRMLGRNKKYVHLFDIERTEARLNRKKGDEYYTEKGKLSAKEMEFYRNMKRPGTPEYEAYNVWTNKEGTGVADYTWETLFKELSEHHTPSEIAKLKKELDSKKVEGYMTRMWTRRALQTIKENSPWMDKMVEKNLQDAARAEAQIWGQNKSKEEISNKRRELINDQEFKDKIRTELYDAVRFGYATVKNPHLIERGALMPEYIKVTNEKGRQETVKVYEDSMENTVEAYASRMSKFLATVRYFPEWTGLGSKYKLGENKRLQVEALETDATVGAYAALAIKRQLGVDRTHMESLNRPMYKGLAWFTNVSAAVGLSSPLSGIKNLLIGQPRTAGHFGFKNTIRSWSLGFDATAKAQARVKGQLEYGAKTLELERVGWKRFSMAKIFRANLMTQTENFNRIVSSNAGQLYFGTILGKLRGEKGMFRMKTNKGRMRRVMSEVWHLTPEEISLLETTKNLSAPEISSKYTEIMHKVGHFSHVATQGGTSTVLLPLWMSSREGRPLTLFQRMAMSTTIDSYRNFVKPLLNYGNPAPLIRATMSHAVSGAALFWLYKELLGKEAPIGSKLTQDDMFDRVLMNLWRSEFLGVLGEVLSPYDKDMVAPVMEPVVLRNLAEAKDNLFNLLSGGKTLDQATSDYITNTVVVVGQAAEFYKKRVASPYYEKFKSTRSWTNKWKMEKGLPKYSPDGLITRRQSHYRDLRDAIFFGSDKDIALNYWSAYNTIVTELERKNPRSSVSWRKKQAKQAIKAMIGHFNPLNVSDSMQGTSYTMKKEFLNWLTPENRRIAKDTEKNYRYKIRLYNRIINNPTWRRKYSTYI
jgi:hypothetical protein